MTTNISRRCLVQGGISALVLGALGSAGREAHASSGSDSPGRSYISDLDVVRQHVIDRGTEHNVFESFTAYSLQMPPEATDLDLPISVAVYDDSDPQTQGTSDSQDHLIVRVPIHRGNLEFSTDPIDYARKDDPNGLAYVSMGSGNEQWLGDEGGQKLVRKIFEPVYKNIVAQLADHIRS